MRGFEGQIGPEDPDGVKNKSRGEMIFSRIILIKAVFCLNQELSKGANATDPIF